MNFYTNFSHSNPKMINVFPYVENFVRPKRWEIAFIYTFEYANLNWFIFQVEESRQP